MFELKEITDDDHHFLVELHNDPIVLKNITHPSPVTMTEHMKWWDSIKHSSSEKRFLFVVNGERVGIAKIYAIDTENSSCVLGADIHKNFRGRGYARQLWALLLRFAFIELRLHRVGLTTAAYNKVAIRLYEKIGFQWEGLQCSSLKRDGVFHDQICMYMLNHWWKAQNDS